LLELKRTLTERCRPEAVGSVTGRAALEALQAGRYGRVDLLIYTYNNGNEPMEIDGRVRQLHCVLNANRVGLSARL
jgi:hypothetical protein